MHLYPSSGNLAQVRQELRRISPSAAGTLFAKLAGGCVVRPLAAGAVPVGVASTWGKIVWSVAADHPGLAHAVLAALSDTAKAFWRTHVAALRLACERAATAHAGAPVPATAAAAAAVPSFHRPALLCIASPAIKRAPIESLRAFHTTALRMLEAASRALFDPSRKPAASALPTHGNAGAVVPPAAANALSFARYQLEVLLVMHVSHSTAATTAAQSGKSPWSPVGLLTLAQGDQHGGSSGAPSKRWAAAAASTAVGSSNRSSGAGGGGSGGGGGGSSGGSGRGDSLSSPKVCSQLLRLVAGLVLFCAGCNPASADVHLDKGGIHDVVSFLLDAFQVWLRAIDEDASTAFLARIRVRMGLAVQRVASGHSGVNRPRLACLVPNRMSS